MSIYYYLTILFNLIIFLTMYVIIINIVIG